MTSKWIVWLQSVPVFGSAMLAIMQSAAGVGSLASLVATTVGVVTGSLCIGSQLFDQLHASRDSDVMVAN